MKAPVAPFSLLETVNFTQIEIPNTARVKEKLARFISDGTQHFNIVADFDQTMSRYYYNGEKVPTSYGALESTLSETQIHACQELMKYYRPLEVDMSIPYDQKFTLMEEWHHRGNEVICNPPFANTNLKTAVSGGHLVLRNGVDTVLRISAQHSVKIFIVSAGIGNVISYCLEGFTGFDSVEVYSNTIEFDSEGMSTCFKTPVLHSLSKPRALATKHLKRNVLLIGDMPHDLQMVAHHDQDRVLSIGYFNDETKFELANYTDRFDIVVKNDGNFKVAEVILGLICGTAYEETATLKPLFDCLGN